jgi:hypothetical protein
MDILQTKTHAHRLPPRSYKVITRLCHGNKPVPSLPCPHPPSLPPVAPASRTTRVWPPPPPFLFVFRARPSPAGSRRPPTKSAGCTVPEAVGGYWVGASRPGRPARCLRGARPITRYAARAIANRIGVCGALKRDANLIGV